MSHYTYIEKRKHLRPMINLVCGWAEFSFCIGGIAWHKVEDLEQRLNKMFPEPLPHTKEAIADLHSAWRYLREITEEADPAIRDHKIRLASIFLRDK